MPTNVVPPRYTALNPTCLHVIIFCAPPLYAEVQCRSGGTREIANTASGSPPKRLGDVSRDVPEDVPTDAPTAVPTDFGCVPTDVPTNMKVVPTNVPTNLKVVPTNVPSNVPTNFPFENDQIIT